MQDLNRCPECTELLVAHEEIIAMNGKLYCSHNCAISVLVDDLRTKHPLLKYNTLIEMAKVMYEDMAEVVRAEDVLCEDLQEVQIAVTFYKTIKLPRIMSEDKMKEVAEKLWNEGTVCAEPDDCDDVRFECALVKDRNSEHNKEV